MQVIERESRVTNRPAAEPPEFQEEQQCEELFGLDHSAKLGEGRSIRIASDQRRPVSGIPVARWRRCLRLYAHKEFTHVVCVDVEGKIRR